MQVPQSIPTSLREAFGLILLVFLLATSIWFAPITEPAVKRSLDSIHIAKFPSGLALYTKAGSSAEYYPFSPWNDYLVDNFGSKHILLDKDVPARLDPGFWSTKRPAVLSETLLGYLNILPTTYGVEQPYDTVYSVRTDDNVLNVIRKIEIDPGNRFNSAAQTLRYNQDDVIYSPQTNKLFVELDIKQVRYFYNQYGIWLHNQELPPEANSYENISWKVPAGEVVLFSPSLNKRILISAQQDQQLFVNTAAQTIELHQPISANQTSIVSVFNIRAID